MPIAFLRDMTQRASDMVPKRETSNSKSFNNVV